MLALWGPELIESSAELFNFYPTEHLASQLHQYPSLFLGLSQVNNAARANASESIPTPNTNSPVFSRMG